MIQSKNKKKTVSKIRYETDFKIKNKNFFFLSFALILFVCLLFEFLIFFFS